MRQYIDTAQDISGNALPFATCKVLNYPGGANASIFSDNGLTPIGTSIVAADLTGQFSFFAADGDYILQLFNNGTLYKTQTPVTLFDGAPQLTLADTGVANAYAVVGSFLEKALRVGLRTSFQAANSNATGASTFQYNTLAVKPLVIPGGVAPSAAEIVAGGIYGVEYDGASWQLKTYTLTAAQIVQQVFPQTNAESNAGVVPTNFAQQELTLLRYGTNTTPGVTDMAAALNAAISVAAQYGGATVTIPPGTFFLSAPIALIKNLRIKGAGKEASFFNTSHAGSGFTSTWPTNASTAVNIALNDLSIANSNGANAGAGFVDVGGTFLDFTGFRVSGFKYSMIFDQSELADCYLCDFEFPHTGGVWMVNGTDWPTAAPPPIVGFTNRIGLKSCQFNSAAGTGIAIIDDGGLCHTVQDCDFSGWLNHLRSANCMGLNLIGGEWEACTGPCVIFATTTSVLGTAVTKSFGVGLFGCSFAPANGQAAVNVASQVGQLLNAGSFFSTTVVPFTGMGSCSSFDSVDAVIATPAAGVVDAFPTSYFITGNSQAIAGDATLTSTNRSTLNTGLQRFAASTTATGPGGSPTAQNFAFPYVAGGLYQIARGGYDATGLNYSHRVSFWIETSSGTFVEQTTRTMDLQGGGSTVGTDTVTRSGANLIVTPQVNKAATSFTNYAQCIRMN